MKIKKDDDALLKGNKKYKWLKIWNWITIILDLVMTFAALIALIIQLAKNLPDDSTVSQLVWVFLLVSILLDIINMSISNSISVLRLDATKKALQAKELSVEDLQAQKDALEQENKDLKDEISVLKSVKLKPAKKTTKKVVKKAKSIAKKKTK